MIEIQNPKRYDLEDRVKFFAAEVRRFTRVLPRNTQNNEDVKQLIRSSGSVGANYIEANEAVSKKDFILRLKISRKEAKETLYWLDLVDVGLEKNLGMQREALIKECTEIMKIVGAILHKSESSF